MAQDLRSVKITSGALQESPLRGGSITLRGVIDAGSLKALRYDDYQREALPISSLRQLTTAVKLGNVLPDIEIGMRGEKVRGQSDDYFLQDDCYVIDGQQRVNACINALAQWPGTPVFLGATVHFGTDKAWERERFRILNSQRVKVSPNVLLRNMREDHPGIMKVFELCEASDAFFPLGGKVSWDQNMKRGKLLTAMNVLKITGNLHGHISPGFATSIDNLAPQLDVLGKRMTMSLMRDNIRTYFDVVDEVWGIRTVQYRQLSVHLAAGFLMMLARFFSNHLDFWQGVNGHKLFVAAPHKSKLASFPLNDPAIAPLASSAGASRNILYHLLVKHMNSGKRTKRLVPRPDVDCGDAGLELDGDTTEE